MERSYLIIRRTVYWLLFLLFFIVAPTLVFYSLGYQFDVNSKKFLKTGALSIKTFPKGASVTLNNEKLPDTTPCNLRELLPREYSLTLEKEGFYPYQIPVTVKPAAILDINVVLVPRMENIDKLKLDLNIYKFFLTKHLFGDKIIILADKGVYSISPDLKETRKISSQNLGDKTLNTIDNLKESSSRIVFWNKDNIWTVEDTQNTDNDADVITELYESEEDIKEVFFGLKEHYLIIHDGLKVVALDIQSPKVFFTIMELKNKYSRIFYDSASEALYIKDRIPNSNAFSFFKIALLPLIEKKKTNEKTP
ncbi:MAG: PEGA domain-containing protein [Candidatus Omnitrophica bacterium]|nr:PEGA domain-containing protein [Candidatus Omnitrophota bacterium]